MRREANVLILLTGGTIGQRGAAGGAVPDAGATAGLAAGSAPDGVAVRAVQVMQRDSPDVSPRDWSTLADRVAAGFRDGADGVVILHGTDTLAYTAAALSFALPGIDRPVILTGSMIPGSQPGSDAPANLRAACAVAAVSGAAVSGADALDGADALPGAGGLPGADTLAGAGGLAGVGVVFGSPRGGADILPGTRVLKVRTADPAAFIAVGGQTWGRVADGRVDLVPRPRPAPHSRPASWVPASSGGFSEDVDLIKVTPMTTAERLRRQLRGLAGVVIEGFGAGHVPRPHLEVLGGFAGPVVISTQVLTDAERLGTYASDRLLTGLPQVIEGGAMTSVAALVKLSWALAHNIDARKIMSTELAGEFGTPGFTVESAAGSHTIGWQED